MSEGTIPNQTYFTGLNYNPSFFQQQTGITLDYANQNFLQRVGANPTSSATQTTFQGLSIAILLQQQQTAQ